MLIDVNAIIPNPHQPRRNFDEDALAALAASMHANGLVQSITVEEVPEGYQLIAGERRWRAAKMLGWQQIEANVRPSRNGGGETWPGRWKPWSRIFSGRT